MLQITMNSLPIKKNPYLKTGQNINVFSWTNDIQRTTVAGM